MYLFERKLIRTIQAETMKCIFHEDISTNIRLRPLNILVHEHLFIDSDDISVSCPTCGQYFCKSCGRLVGCQINTIPQAAMKTVASIG